MKANARHCDWCGRLLQGFQGTDFIDNPYISFKGTMTHQFPDNEGFHDHCYISKNPTDEHDYCDFECLKAEAAHAYEKYMKKKTENLRRETDEA